MAFDFKNATKQERQAEYDKIAKMLGDDQFFTKKELHYLPEILQDGEQVLAFTSGLMDGNTWLITLTDKRLIFLDKGMLWGLKQTVIPLNKVNAVSCSTGIMFGEIHISHGSATQKIDNVWKKTVIKFTNIVQEQLDLLNAPSGQSVAAASGPAPEEDKYAKLEKLAGLKEKGIISEAEFAAEKAKLLGA
jgi:hypothetical protein